MSEQRLLRVIANNAGGGGFADGDTVKKEYGAGFNEVFLSLVQRGHIERSGPVGSIKLSPSGEAAAED